MVVEHKAVEDKLVENKVVEGKVVQYITFCDDVPNAVFLSELQLTPVA